MTKPATKPKLRGWFHQEAFFVSLGAGILLVLKSTTTPSLIGSTVYALGLLLLFGVSAVYHRPFWQPHQRAFMRRLDHSSIFIFIACSMTAMGLLAMPAASAQKLIILIWSVALFGTLKAFFWTNAPKWFSSTLYALAGWIVFPFLPEMRLALSDVDLALIFAGGIIYTLGAVFYALKRPKLWGHVFGYHELFHVCTIIAATLHFAVIYKLVH